jgi:hypothetical protein
MALGLTGFALLGGQPEDRSAVLPAVEDAAAACQPAPTIVKSQVVV